MNLIGKENYYGLIKVLIDKLKYDKIKEISLIGENFCKINFI